MSRRRTKPTRDVAEYVIDVICTGRGTHRRLEIEQLNVWSPEHSGTDDYVVDISEGGTGRHDWHFVVPDSGHDTPHQSITFACSLCRTPGKRPRTVPLQRETLTRIAVGLRHAGVNDLDISALSAIL